MAVESWTQCSLESWGAVRIPWNEIPQWRKNPGPVETFKPATHLKLADEQTVLGAAAVFQAIQRGNLQTSDFGNWGIIAGPHFLGRARVAQIFARYQKLGVRSVPPLGIPTLSQHSVASTLCLVLGCHGPSFGFSGNTGQIAEGLLNAMTMLGCQDCAGVWCVFTGWEPEPTPDGNGQIVGTTIGYGIAFAFTPETGPGLMRWLPASKVVEQQSNMTLSELADLLERPDPFRIALPGGGAVELEPCQATAQLRRAG